MKKRALSLLLVLVMVFGPLPVTSRAGQLGNGLEYKVYEDHVEITKFIGPENETEVVIPAQIENLPVTVIGYGVFSGYSKLAKVTLPGSLTSIGDSAFGGCTSLKNIKIPDGVSYIGHGAFSDCINLYQITIPDSVTFIGDNIFSDCNQLSYITLPDGITYIGKNAFFDCFRLSGIDLPKSLSSIGDYAFYNCAIDNIDFPNSLTSIGQDAFSSTKLISISLPANLISISDGAFRNCTRMDSIYFNGDAPRFGSAIFSAVTATAYYPANNATWTDDVMQDYGGTITWVPYTPHIHEYIAAVTTPTCTEQGFTTYTCSCGDSYVDDYVEALGHDMGQWNTATTPTCTEEGSESRGCSRCDHTETRSIDATGHSHEAVVTAPTCTEQGFTTYICTICGESYVDAYVDALGHDLFVFVVEPTCTADGYYIINCTRCDYSEKHITEATGHSCTAVVTAPTCTARGYTTYTCTVCGDSYRDDYTMFLGHNYRSGICTRCGEVDSDYQKPVVNPFNDVPEGSFYYTSVLWAVENGITSGTSRTTFSPGDSCLRAHVVTFLWRAAGSPAPKSVNNPFVDVKPGAFYYDAVLWAVEKGITSGTDATHFNPNGVCNRAQVVSFLHRAFGAPVMNGVSNPFSDVPSDAWYTTAVLWAIENGITNGVDATHFGPTTACNRAQVVTFLYRAYH